MAATTTPATILTEPTWSFLTVSRSLTIVPPVAAAAASGSTPAVAAVPGSLAPAWNINLTQGAQQFLGDASGNPVPALPPAMPAPGSTPSMTNVALDLSEVVTRKDGTTLTVLALLDSIAMASAAPTAPAAVTPAS